MPDEQREPTQARVERVAEWLWRHSGGRTPLDEATDVIGQPISDAYREQAREIIALLEPASPTPQEQEQARVDPADLARLRKALDTSYLGNGDNTMIDKPTLARVLAALDAASRLCSPTEGAE